MEREAVHHHIAALPGVIPIEAWGETSMIRPTGAGIP